MDTPVVAQQTDLEHHFSHFRDQIIGIDQTLHCPDGERRRIVYADWTASGRNYGPIEDRIQHEIMPYVANTHTDTNSTGMVMTYAYHRAKQLIKEHVNASSEDVIIVAGSGMTGAINKFQRILGMKIHEKFRPQVRFEEGERPVIFVTHMEHHSNQTTWLETVGDVVIVEPTDDGLVSLDNFEAQLDAHRSRKTKIAAITSCSNVSGLVTPYHDIAEMVHRAGGLCFVDFACSAPYIAIDMHPADRPDAYLDAIYFSPHKFLGGPGTSGILIFNRNLYHNTVPDNPGGGTVDWTNPWGEHKYVDDIELREDGGTPPFIQTMKVALCVELKNQMGVEKMMQREEEQLKILWETLDEIPNLHVLAGEHRSRLGVISFYIDDLHYNIAVKLLNDRFGIQTRGGCSCAGTYGHYLLNVEPETSKNITDRINLADYSTKPGWVRLSIHPTHTDEEIRYLSGCLKELAEHHAEWAASYEVNHAKHWVNHKDLTTRSELMDKVEMWLTSPLGGEG